MKIEFISFIYQQKNNLIFFTWKMEKISYFHCGTCDQCFEGNMKSLMNLMNKLYNSPDGRSFRIIELP